MNKKGFKKIIIRKNKNGYWQKGGDSEQELKLALTCLIIACAGVAVGIITRL